MAEARCICETRGLLHCGSPLCDCLSFLSAIWSEGASDISLESCDGAKSKSCTIVLKEEVVKPVLKNLLKLYEKNWELIEEENYRVLADAIFDEAETQAAEENRPPQNAVYIVYMGTYSHGLRDDLNRVSKFEESHIGFLGSLLDRKLKEFPKGTRNLVSLRHLDVRGCDDLSHMPRGLGELTNLQTLTNFVMGPEGADCSELGELKSLVNLRGELRITKLIGSKAGKHRSSDKRCNPTHPLAELQYITRLVLPWWTDDKEEQEADCELEILKPHPNLEWLTLLDYRGKRFPSWMERANIEGSLPNICSIVLDSCKGWRHLLPLGLLTSLRELWLGDMGDLEYPIHDDKEEDAEGKNPYFPALEKLRIYNCPLLVVDGKQFMSIREVVFSDHYRETLPGWLPSLPHLQTLKVYRCSKMVSLPEWMGDLKSLQEIRLEYCNSLASIPDCVLHLTSLQRLQIPGCEELYRRYNTESGEDWHQISHIPTVSVKK